MLAVAGPRVEIIVQREALKNCGVGGQVQDAPAMRDGKWTSAFLAGSTSWAAQAGIGCDSVASASA